jgi:L-threonylcarbamoyladenylate synthase
LQTEIVGAATAVERAVKLLRAGEVVALPTETVYGVAADARNPDAVAKIFEAKERPRFDPLIVHLPTRKSLYRVAHIESDLVSSLMEKFWPGPLTFILPKQDNIPDIVTAGLETVAVRMSAHSIFQQIASAFAGPLAAPSANRFGRISPTMAQHVYDELAGRIPLIVDGGPTTHGIESTIVRVIDDAIEILRQGPITAEMLREFAPVRAGRRGDAVVAPGQLKTHYAPRTRLILVDDLAKLSPERDKRIGVLSFRPTPSSRAERSEVEGSRGKSLKLTTRDPATSLGMTFAVTYCLSATGDLREAATNLFQMLRELDAANLDLIVAEKVPEEGIGVAINERLERAAFG